MTDETPGLRGGGDRARLRRRAAFLRDLAEAKALRERVTPRRSRRARANQLHRMLTYRHC